MIQLSELLLLLGLSHLYLLLELLIEVRHFSTVFSEFVLVEVEPFENGVSGEDGLTEKKR